ncbi:MAG TPA: hypothetical protein VNZ22_17385 [Bacillota bacterium]|nr:hypothetical protein [Bacillota bacterium]
MENLENSPAAQPENQSMRQELEGLRSLVVSLLVLMIVLSGTFNLFLLRQVKTARADLPALRQVVADYNKNSAPAINEFVKRLSDYSKTHPDFVPVLVKYGIIKPSGAPTAAPAAPAKK